MRAARVSAGHRVHDPVDGLWTTLRTPCGRRDAVVACGNLRRPGGDVHNSDPVIHIFLHTHLCVTDARCDVFHTIHTPYEG